ncbi:MAG TPA: HAMP domain-containing sensor histidine kinase [Candidatus Obscuribacterales bacterium]
MFKSLRWRFTLWFLALSAVAYALLITLGTVLFHVALTSALDDELQQLAHEVVPSISYESGKVIRTSWPSKLHTEPAKVLASVQLYDLNRKLLEEHGRQGVNRLVEGAAEISEGANRVRSYAEPLYSDRQLVGHLQVQLPTEQRARAVEGFLVVMLVISPLLLLTLGLCGYVFAGMATKPVEKSFTILRDFMTDAGHELHTPISIIQSTTQNLKRRATADKGLEQKLSVVMRSAERMERLVKDLKLLSRLEVRHAPPPMSNVRFDHIVAGACEDMEAMFQEKGITLTSEIASQVIVEGDPDSLARLVTNLLSNALRYTDAPGSVRVSLRTRSKVARLIVEDSGIGIPKTSLPNIFNRFYRVDQSRSRASGGSGLGLSIVKAVVETHNGRIDVSSEVGKGTEFVVLLPCKPV